MSTRSRIGIMNEDGTIKSIYCHYDGYPEYNGKMLNEHYMDIVKVKALISLGDISYLEEKLVPDNNEQHSFDKPAKNVVVAYGRDRGESNTDAVTSKSFEDFMKCCNDSWAEYSYLFRDNKWECYSGGELL